MANIIGYRQYPNKKEFSEQYATMTQKELAKHYGCVKLRIRGWIKHFGLKLRPQGGGNNRKYKVDKDILKKLVDAGYTVKEIGDILEIRSGVSAWIKRLGIQRQPRTSEYNKYCQRVRRLSELTYVQYKDQLNPNNYPRTLCGVEGGYQLDHIIGIAKCYHDKISEDTCASLQNLQVIPWLLNLEKREFKNYRKRVI